MMFQLNRNTTQFLLLPEFTAPTSIHEKLNNLMGDDNDAKGSILVAVMLARKSSRPRTLNPTRQRKSFASWSPFFVTRQIQLIEWCRIAGSSTYYFTKVPD